jgi:LmbE family N-acetylglucosaminyl deacetylase
MRGMTELDLLLVVPHPDDEVFGAGGMFARMAAHGRPVASLTLTRGRAGRTLGLAERSALADLRERELRASLEALGVREVRVEDLPDFVTATDRGLDPHPGIAGVDPEDAIGPIQRALDELRPRAVLTFPPNGSNGHPDHVATHRSVLAALDRSSHRPEALFYYASERPYEGEARAGFMDPDEIRSRHLPPTHYVEVGPFVEAKLRAMGHHQTQALSVLTFMRRFTRRLLVESFHRARPEVDPDEGPRTVPWL